MKRLLALLICIIMMSLTGCVKEYPLSDSQTGIVAEYMAGLLLKNDKVYSPSLLDQQEISEIQEENKKEEKKEEERIETEKEESTIGETNPSSMPEHQATEEPNINYTLAEVIGDSNFNISYASYKLVDTYPEDETNRVFSVDPRKDHQLLVVNFLIENITDTDKKIDLSTSDVQYQLDINVGTVFKPQFVLLENNLQYIDMVVEAGATIPAVLIFEVTKDIDMANINLIASKDSKTDIIKIK